MASTIASAVRDPVGARDRVVMAACAAAAAVADPAVNERDTAARLMEALGVVSSAFPVGTAPTFGEFRGLLREPLKRLFPPGVDPGPVGDVVLLDAGGALCDEAEDICREHFVPLVALHERWSFARLGAEQEEQRLFKALRSLGQDGYARARELLITHPAGELRDLRHGWDTMWPDFGDYTPVAELGRVQVNGCWFPCPLCRWPMRADPVTGGVWRVSCEAHAADGITYSTRPVDNGGPPVLVPAGRTAAAVDARPATSDHLAVSRSVWRYVTLPGLMEVGLRDHAQRLGAQVTMWPNMDEFDLLIEICDRSWRVDAKAWASPLALAQSLLDDPVPAGHLEIVVPDRQRSACAALNDMLSGRRMTVRTLGSMKQLLDRASGGSR